MDWVASMRNVSTAGELNRQPAVNPLPLVLGWFIFGVAGQKPAAPFFLARLAPSEL